MFEHLFWWGGDALVFLLLLRGMQTGLPRRFPVFCFYLAYTLIEGITLTAVRLLWQDYYVTASWLARFPLITVEYGLLWEISRSVFRRFPGAGKVADRFLLLIFAFVTARYFLTSAPSGSGFFDRPVNLLERDLHIAEAIVLFGIIASARYYMIRAPRNLFGLMLGYGLFISVDVVALTAMSYWPEYWIWLGNAISLAFILCLVVWIVTLWIPDPVPVDSGSPVPERTYRVVSGETSSAIRKAMDALLRMIFPWRW